MVEKWWIFYESSSIYDSRILPRTSYFKNWPVQTRLRSACLESLLYWSSSCNPDIKTGRKNSPSTIVESAAFVVLSSKIFKEFLLPFHSSYLWEAFLQQPGRLCAFFPPKVYANWNIWIFVVPWRPENGEYQPQNIQNLNQINSISWACEWSLKYSEPSGRSGTPWQWRHHLCPYLSTVSYRFSLRCWLRTFWASINYCLVWKFPCL